MTIEELEAERKARQKNSAQSAWDAVVAAFKKHYHDPDLMAARALYAAVAAHGLNGQPVWPMAVAPPSSMKTEIIRALNGLPNVHAVDELTPKTFISGQIREDLDPAAPPSSLLHRIGTSGTILCADFSTILGIKSEDRKTILAQLRRIYDGDLRKEFGTAEGAQEWKGRITFVAGVTPEIDKQYQAIQSLGDRFVMVRWKRAGREAALQAMKQDLTLAHREVSAAVHDLFLTLPSTEPGVEDAMLDQLSALAEFAARGRSNVPRASDGDRAIIGEPEAESAPRLAQQLCQMAKGSALLSHRLSVGPDDFAVAKRAAFDCIPGRRRALLEWAIQGGKIGRESSTKRYDAEELEVLGLVERDHLSPFAERLLREIEQEELTRTPPSTSQEMSIYEELKGTSRELDLEGDIP
jgi:hypothetical protein